MRIVLIREARMLINILRLIRLKQWAKNLLVFAAWLFTGKYTDTASLVSVIVAALSMSLASSGVYVFNDIFDRKRDQNHPKKKHRPIASGAISVSVGIAIGTVLLAISIALAFSLTLTCVYLVLGYLTIQIAYNLKLKKIPLLDVFILASGFIIRAILGASALIVPISGWFLICTGALALMMGFAKRRNEFVAQGDKANKSRENLTSYSQQALDALVILFATSAGIFYGIYTLESSTAKAHPALILTTPFVFYGITRYTLLVFQKNEGGEPADLLFADPHILGSVILFLIFAGITISGSISLPFLVP